MNAPLVSIGIPTFNRPEGLRRALASAANQTYHNLEIIVSDNCSTNTEVRKVTAEFMFDSRVRFIQQPENKGPIFNFNFLLSEASGDFFMWLADDDWLDLNYVESCILFLTENVGYSAAYGAGKIYSNDGSLISLDARINLEHSSPSDRIKCYYNSVTINGCFSAVISTKYKAALSIINIIGIDWLIVARLAVFGKYKMLENTNCHISAGGTSSTIDGLTTYFNMPVFTKSFPYLTIGLNVIRDILGNWSNAYDTVRLVDRLNLAKDCFLIMFTRHHIMNELKPGMKKLINFKRKELRAFIRGII